MLCTPLLAVKFPLFAQQLSGTAFDNFKKHTKKAARKQIFKLLSDEEIWQGAVPLPQDELQDPGSFFSPSVPPRAGPAGVWLCLSTF